MRHKDLRVGAVVYHSIFTFWLRGVVIQHRATDSLGYRTAEKWRVAWEGKNNLSTWCRATLLRKTFDAAKHAKFEALTKKRK